MTESQTTIRLLFADRGAFHHEDLVVPAVPVYIPGAYAFARKMAENIGGTPLSNLYEVFFNAPLTAHILGGCSMGTDPKRAVIDTDQKLFGYDTLYVTDASVIPANLGVNPVLTIVALAERAMSRVRDR